MLDDVREFAVSFWFRHSFNTPVENGEHWADFFHKGCQTLFRVRETEAGDSS